MKKPHVFFALALVAMSILFAACTDEPSATGTVTDKDGNVYQTVTIGTQTWMVENLKTTKYNDGTSIPNVTDNTTWGNLIIPAYCWYNNDAANKNTYGALYNWEAVNTGKLAPTGWRIPTDDDWTTLVNYVTAHLGTSTSLAKALAATTNWTSDTNVGAIGNDLSNNNSTGFTALPGGYRNNMNGLFFNIGTTGGWWSATEFNSGSANYKCMWNNQNSLYGNIDHKVVGYSVRCIKN